MKSLHLSHFLAWALPNMAKPSSFQKYFITVYVCVCVCYSVMVSTWSNFRGLCPEGQTRIIRLGTRDLCHWAISPTPGHFLCPPLDAWIHSLCEFLILLCTCIVDTVIFLPGNLPGAHCLQFSLMNPSLGISLRRQPPYPGYHPSSRTVHILWSKNWSVSIGKQFYRWSLLVSGWDNTEEIF